MPSAGMDGETGRLVTGWDRTRSSIVGILSTPIGERVQRRDFGAEVDGFLDKPQNEEVVVDFIMVVAEALEPRLVEGFQYGEPCFRLLQCGLDMSIPGDVEVVLSGLHMPNGHLGDFTVEGLRKFSISFTAAS